MERRKRRIVLCLCLISLFAISFALGFYLITRSVHEEASSTPFEIHFFDVGQADSALILCGGKTMLIDGGKPEDSERLISLLKRQSVERLDYVVCTHSHADHAGGLAAITEAFPVSFALVSDTEESTREAYLFYNALKTQSTPLYAASPGDSLNLGGAWVTVLGPLQTAEDLNDASLILRIVYGDISVLFMGDAGFSEENDLLSMNLLSETTVLKVGHHGAESSSGEAFLSLIHPRYAVISTGLNNDYGHPHQTLLDRLHSFNIRVFRTDLQGEITLTSDGKTVGFTVEGDLNADVLSHNANISEDTVRTFIVNCNSGVFHKPDCVGAKSMKEENRMELFGTHDQMIARGYKPCARCDP